METDFKDLADLIVLCSGWIVDDLVLLFLIPCLTVHLAFAGNVTLPTQYVETLFRCGTFVNFLLH